jgi:integrase
MHPPKSTKTNTRSKRKAKTRIALRAPSYRKHRPSGRAVVTLAGKDHYLGKWGSAESRERYERFIAEWLASGRVTTPGPRRSHDDGTVNELVAAYWSHLERRYTGHTREALLDRQRQAFRPLAELYGEQPLADFGPASLKAVRARMVTDGLTRGEVNRRVSIIRRMIRWGVSEELAPADLAHRLDAIEHLCRGELDVREGRKVQPVPSEHVEPVLARVAPEVAAMVRLQVLSGMRSGEVTAMRPCDVDRSGGVWEYRPQRHKTEHHGKERLILLGPRAQDVLRPFLDRVPRPEPDAPIFRPDRAEAERSRRRRIARRTPMTPSQQRRKRKARRKRAPRTAYSPGTYRNAILRGIEQENAARLRAGVLDALQPLLDEKQQRTFERVLRRIAAGVIEKRLEPALEHAAARAGLPPRRTDELLRAARDAAQEVARVPSWHPHRLRHSAATNIRKEFGLDAARACLGQSGLGVANDYAELDAEKAREVMERVG